MQKEYYTSIKRSEIYGSDEANEYLSTSGRFYERPYGFMDEDLRRKFINSSARIAGVGGGGATLAVMLAKEGVHDFSIADVDKFDETNVGRIPLITRKDIGEYKVDVIADLITEHNPAATVRVYADGLQPENADEFVGLDTMSGNTIVFDEIDLFAPEIALELHRASRRFGRFAIAATDVARGGMVTTFDPSSRYTFEHYMGASPKDSVEEYMKKVNGFQWPTIPNLPLRGSLDTLAAISDKDAPAPLPTTLDSVLIATHLAKDEYSRILTIDDSHFDNPHFYPNVHCADPSSGEDFTTRYPRTRAAMRLAVIAMRDKLGLNPKSSYTDADRNRRSIERGEL